MIESEYFLSSYSHSPNLKRFCTSCCINVDVEEGFFMVQKKTRFVFHRPISLILAVLGLLLLTAILAILTDFEKSDITSLILFDSLTITHLASYVGAMWIAIFTPIYYVLKSHSPKRFKTMLNIHVLANLLAFTLITTHYVHREINSAFLGTGTALYITVLLLVATGIMQRFNIISGKKVKFIHLSMTSAFYLILVIHIIGSFVRI